MSRAQPSSPMEIDLLDLPFSARRLAGFVVLAMALALPAAAQETERLTLSGTGYGDAVDWEFSVTGGRRAGEQTTIPVPSQWEQHGFGGYNYGHDDDKHEEQGHYRHRFQVPDAWQGKIVDLVFEGVMTDTEARLNGKLVGPVHRGSFYRFRYDVTELLLPGQDNVLEVAVSKHSSDKSVNRAERDADYWVFGGIFRPVYLEARPPESIRHVAIDARHDGTLTASVRLRGIADAVRLTARVEDLSGTAVSAPFSIKVSGETRDVELRAQLSDVKAWSAESPDLYRLVVELHRVGNALPEAGELKIVHRHAERFGFRTVEVRSDGLFLNGERVLLKGVNRHAFWPASGRTLNRDLDVRDVELIKGMNMNAVRASHYPPDKSFLEACDELGLYVINELAGWHDAYGTTVGRQLVREMVERDVNHPSVILWANGNEDGWNTALDGDFAEHDPQRRSVIHPRGNFGGFDALHYPTWSELAASLDPESLRNQWRGLFGELPLVMTTEVLHGLYDGGSAAGLEDYWRLLSGSTRAAGAFLWSFTDEAIERTDRDGQLDTDGNHAPDGVLGPYRELSANYHAVREIFSPVQIKSGGRFTGTVEVENRFDMTDLSRCRFDWRLLDLPAPGGDGIEILDFGTISGPSVPPGESGALSLPAAVDWRTADALSLTARDPSGRDLWTWNLPIREPRTALRSLSRGTAATGDESVDATQSSGRLTLRSTSVTATFDLETGRLLNLSHRGQAEPMHLDGPWHLGIAEPAPESVRHERRDDAYAVDVRFEHGRASAHWLLLPSGWLRLSYSFEAEGSKDLVGVRFEVAEGEVRRVRWLGDGPARVWKNRQHGGALGLWEKAQMGVTEIEASHEPKLAGYYSNIAWAELEISESQLLVAFERPDLYLGLFSPTFPSDAQDAIAAVPPSGISVLHGISAIGTKFHPPEDLGPQSRRTDISGGYRGVVWFFVRPRAQH